MHCGESLVLQRTVSNPSIVKMAASAAAAGSSPGLCPSFAVICSFLERYGGLLDLPELTFPQLERYLQETSTGERHFLCVSGLRCGREKSSYTSICLGANSSVRFLVVLLCASGRLDSMKCLSGVVLVVAHRRKVHTRAVWTVPKRVWASSVVSWRISGALCGGGFLLAAWLYLRCMFAPHAEHK